MGVPSKRLFRSPTCAPSMDVRRYLDRIDADVGPDPEPTLELLTYLQGRHLRSVPFENLDVVAGRPIAIDVAAHYAKVVDRGRGGFCYELNGLFEWLLAELGFSTRFVEAQVQMDGEFSRRFAHAAVLVDLEADGSPATRDGWYLADVGFGDFARQPLPLTGDPRTDVSGTYRMHALEDGRFETQYFGRRPGEDAGPADEWVTRYRLPTDDRDPTEFEPACEWTQTSPESAFTGRLVCSLATEDGRVTLSENTLTTTADGEQTKRAVAPPERHDVLREAFDIEFDGPLTLARE